MSNKKNIKSKGKRQKNVKQLLEKLLKLQKGYLMLICSSSSIKHKMLHEKEAKKQLEIQNSGPTLDIQNQNQHLEKNKKIK